MSASSPRFRGSLHTWASVAVLPMAIALLRRAETSQQRVVIICYATGIAAMFGGSALYHRISWTAKTKRIMQRVDHSTIFCAIAGTYSPIGVLVLSGGLRVAVLATVWIGALVGVLLQWTPQPPSRVLSAAIYVIVGWAALMAVPQLVAGLGLGAFVLLVAGGLAFTAGSVVYTLKHPDPLPLIFGYHEVFHLFTLIGAGLHYLAIRGLLLRLRG